MTRPLAGRVSFFSSSAVRRLGPQVFVHVGATCKAFSGSLAVPKSLCPVVLVDVLQWLKKESGRKVTNPAQDCCPSLNIHITKQDITMV